MIKEEVIYRNEDSIKPSTAKVLIEALPYIQQLSNKVIVVKFGGNAMTDETLRNNFARDMVLLKQVGLHPVIIHGGGPQITSYLKKLGIESEFANGLRISDPESIHIIEMVLGGLVNKDIVNSITSHGGKAVGLSGKDGGLIRAKKVIGEGEFKNIDFKNTGTVKSIDPEVVSLLDGSPFIPVIAPIGIGDDGKTYNINADTAAGAIASSLKSNRLLILTDVQGVMDTDQNLIKEADEEKILKMIDTGEVSGGMIPKINTCLDSVKDGVDAAVIVDGRVKHAVLLELFTDHGAGTLIR